MPSRVSFPIPTKFTIENESLIFGRWLIGFTRNSVAHIIFEWTTCDT